MSGIKDDLKLIKKSRTNSSGFFIEIGKGSIKKEKEKYQLLNYRLNLRNVGEIFELFGRYDISPILIKGLAAALNYPKPFQRVFSDIDLAVAPEQFDTAQKIIKDHNFNIDLHRGLRHLDTLNWETLFLNSEIINIGTAKIRVLCSEDHLRVLCVHWLNDGGADRTRLWDIYFALLKKGDEFNWERFYDVVSPGRRKWLLTVILLVRDYFGLDITNLPFESEGIQLPGWIKTEIENDWKNDTRLMPLQDVLNNRKELIKQIKKESRRITYRRSSKPREKSVIRAVICRGLKIFSTDQNRH